MSQVHARPDGVLVLELEHVDLFMKRCREQYEALAECAAFVNWRRIERGYPAVLALCFHKSPPTAEGGRIGQVKVDAFDCG
ncbi:hypothetical protein [Paludisphaera mucosa]|uniref:Uncharacterized protein n=1 Tax=Paludisphaera mucosa TaxID=3030827 RepID=A0ABT6F8Y6_9BACT|nr:hypothetical protein [Paludisphaera mucosa]MDG3003853.1 hypothetical protein [Paludisphaera mucosa]